MSVIHLDGRTLTAASLTSIAEGAAVALDEGARERMAASAEWLANHPVDPLETKWRWLSGADAPACEHTRAETFLRGHCAGVGEPLTRREVRALIAARVNVLATGFTGARPEVAERLLALFDKL